MYLLSWRDKYRRVLSTLVEAWTAEFLACVKRIKSTPYFLLEKKKNNHDRKCGSTSNTTSTAIPSHSQMNLRESKHNRHNLIQATTALWSGTNKNRDVSTGLVRSLIHSHRSHVRLLRTACFARTLRCTDSFASPTPSLVRK